MTCATLHAARIIGPLHGVNGRIETRPHEIAQMLSPTFSGFHGRLHSTSQSRNAHGRRRFLTRLWLKIGISVLVFSDSVSIHRLQATYLCITSHSP